MEFVWTNGGTVAATLAASYALDLRIIGAPPVSVSCMGGRVYRFPPLINLIADHTIDYASPCFPPVDLGAYVLPKLFNLPRIDANSGLDYMF